MRWTMLASALVLVGVCAHAQAQIKIGQSAGFTWPAAATVKELTDGAKLYFDSVNAAGGVNGQSIELISADDRYDTVHAAINAKRLVQHGIVAMFLTYGTPQTQAMIPVLEEYQVPLVGPSSGATALHDPVQPYVYNVRTTYQREAERTIKHLGQQGVQQIAIVQVDDSFGADAAIGAQKGFVAIKGKPVAHIKYKSGRADFGVIVPQVVAAQAQAVLFLGSGAEVVEGVKRLRAAGSLAQVVTLSNNASGGFVKALDTNARGTVVSQVFPYERSLSVPIVKQAQALATAQGLGSVTPANLEGFAAAKVLVEGLRRSGKEITRASLNRALESFSRVDIGGLEITYNHNSHTGLDYADLSIIGPDGKFWR